MHEAQWLSPLHDVDAPRGGAQRDDEPPCDELPCDVMIYGACWLDDAYALLEQHVSERVPQPAREQEPGLPKQRWLRQVQELRVA